MDVLKIAKVSRSFGTASVRCRRDREMRGGLAARSDADLIGYCYTEYEPHGWGEVDRAASERIAGAMLDVVEREFRRCGCEPCDAGAWEFAMQSVFLKCIAPASLEHPMWTHAWQVVVLLSERATVFAMTGGYSVWSITADGGGQHRSEPAVPRSPEDTWGRVFRCEPVGSYRAIDIFCVPATPSSLVLVREPGDIRDTPPDRRAELSAAVVDDETRAGTIFV